MLTRHYGKRIYDLEDLYNLTQFKKSIISVSHGFQKPKPASWVINMNGMQIFQLINRGLYVYVTKAELKRFDELKSGKSKLKECPF